MLNKVKEYIKKYELKEGDSVLLACSGGIDSMVLFDILKKLNIDFCVAHCNFMLRGDESIGDEKFVKEKGYKNTFIDMEELMDLLVSDESPSQVSDKIKDILYSKSAEKITNVRPEVASSLFDDGEELEDSEETTDELETETEEESEVEDQEELEPVE